MYEISEKLFKTFAPCIHGFPNDHLDCIMHPEYLDKVLDIGYDMLRACFGWSPKYKWFRDMPFGNNVKRAGLVSHETEARFEGIEIRRHPQCIEIEVYRTEGGVFVFKGGFSLADFKYHILYCTKEMTLAST